MKYSNLLKALLFGMFAQFSIVEDNGGGDGGQDNGGDNGGDGGQNDNQDDQGANGGEGDQGKQKGKLSDNEAQLLKEVMDKKNALKRANEELAKASQRLKEFDGIDPAEVKQLIQEKKDAQTKQLEAQGQWEKLKEQMADAHKAEVSALQAQTKALSDQLQAAQSSISELTVGTAFANSNYIREQLLLTPAKTRAVYGANFAYEDGKIVGYDKPVTSPNKAPLVDSSGEPLPFEEALKKLVEADPERDQMLRSTVKKGANSDTNNRGKQVEKSESLSSREKIAQGLSAYMKKA